MGHPEDCLEGHKKGEGLIKLYNYNGYVQLVVAGYSSQDTRRAAKVLANWNDYNLKGKEMRITSQNENIVMNIPSTSIPEEEIIEESIPEVECPENCICDSLGNIIECRGEKVETKEEKVEIDVGVCNGCIKESTCIPFGIRLIQDDVLVYCDISKQFKKQKEKEESCQNNYECLTNQCSNEVCSSIEEELAETRGLIQKFFDFFKKLFG
jgi:hypothetical protein